MFKTLINLTKLSSLKTFCGVESILDSVKVARVPCVNITSKYSEKVSHKREYRIKEKGNEGTIGEHTYDIDYIKNQSGMFPDKNTPSLIFDGVIFSELSICYIKTTPNNTIFSLTDHLGNVTIHHSCGVEGYKNSKKGTNVAAQQTAITFGSKVLKNGIKNIRIVIQGLGPGRASSVKGLEMSGLNIISLTDRTRVSWNPPRPKKVRRV
ncbi:30S ribosomal protein S11 [Leptopilina boulardi]|uniref:30S ribosomal protein S11 n=1 Tax=Leptopilina boulardi TaxID=63433 RepID=UPI0021F67A3A|nr:30S ribosomal protein S11 [Leptopilina boulardi]